MKVIIKLLAKATVIWKLDWKICSLDDSFKWLGSWCWLLIGGLISSSCGLLYKIAEISSWHGSWLPPEWEFQKPRQKQQCDLWQCSALSLLLAHTPTLSVREITQGLVYQKARITEGHLEVWIPQLPCDFYYCCWVVGHQNCYVFAKNIFYSYCSYNLLFVLNVLQFYLFLLIFLCFIVTLENEKS